MKKKEFMFSFFLIGLGIYVMIQGIAIYRYAADRPFNITNFYISPGFLPVILGGILIVLSTFLFFQSLSGPDGLRVSLHNTVKILLVWFKGLPKDPDIRSMTAAIIIMGIYSYLLIRPLHFWLSSIIFLVGIMLFFRAAKIRVIILASLGSVGVLVILLQLIFRASLP